MAHLSSVPLTPVEQFRATHAADSCEWRCLEHSRPRDRFQLAPRACAPFLPAATFAAVLSIENPFASCAADPVGVTKRDPLNYCTATEELWCDWWTIEKGVDDEYKSSLYWEPYCSESSQINLCKPGSTCDSKEESDTPAENCLFNPTCFCLMDSLAGLPSGGGGSGPTCTPQY